MSTAYTLNRLVEYEQSKRAETEKKYVDLIAFNHLYWTPKAEAEAIVLASIVKATRSWPL